MRLFGIIGKPLDCSPSPKIYNAVFKKRSLPCRYLPFQVAPKHLKNLILCMKLVDVEGLNVTIPYKEAVIPFLDGLDKSAELCGAVNTIVRRKNKFTGYNTDGAGFLVALKKNKKFSPKNKCVMIIGAGGAARGIAAALAGAGAKEILFFNRHHGRAKKAAAFLRKNFPKTTWVASPSFAKADLVVQATPRPLKPARKFLSRKTILFDIRTAKPEGLRMLKAQARLNLELWLGKS